MPRIIISSPEGKRGILEIAKPVVTLGRGNANDLVLNDSSVSRYHAVIKLEGNSVYIADRGSTNGVLLNGEKITQEIPLNTGDLVRVGRYELRLERTDERALQVRRAEWPSTINQIMRGQTPQGPASVQLSDAKAADLAAQLKKLERENYLLTVLYDAGKALNAKLSIDDIAEQVVSLAFRIEGVERGFVMVFDENGQL